MKRTRSWAPVTLTACLTSALASAPDWPTYQHDNLRGGVAAATLPLPLEQVWVHRPSARPQPAWTGPAKWDAYKRIRNLSSMRNFDPVFHVAAAGDAVYYGSSADDAVHCLDARTGSERWAFCTDGPVRLPPACHDGKVYFGSDDGSAYCLDAASAALVWRFKPSPEERLIPCNGKLISPWPIRTGVLVQDGVAYFAASLLPWEASYLCALDAETGAVRYQVQCSNVTMQGAMLASARRLYFPQGRTAPLVFDRDDGTSLGPMRGSRFGGTYAILTDRSELILGHGSRAGWLSLHQGETRDHIASVSGANRMVVQGAMAYLQSGRSLSALDRARFVAMQAQRTALLNEQTAVGKRLKKLREDATDEQRKLKARLQELRAELPRVAAAIQGSFRWTVPCPHAHALVLAGDVLVVGGDSRIVALRADAGREVWSAKVDGRAHGLAAARARLFVSTDTGAIHCFAATRP